MHHLNELSRKRALYLTLLTPSEVIQPINRTFVVTKHQYKNIDEPDQNQQDSLRPQRQPQASRFQRQDRQQSTENTIYQKRIQIKKSQSTKRRIIFKEDCPTCGQKHIPVQYFGHRHICLKCREFLKSSDGAPAKVMLDSNDNIRALATDERGLLYEVNYQDMKIFDRKCFASFAGPHELVILLHDEGWTF